MIKVKKILGDDIFGLWHIKQIIVKKNGKRFSFAPDHETFPTKEEAERHAHHRARQFIQRKLEFLNGKSSSSTIWKGETVVSRLASSRVW
jgi:hypothetical protein